MPITKGKGPTPNQLERSRGANSCNRAAGLIQDAQQELAKIKRQILTQAEVQTLADCRNYLDQDIQALLDFQQKLSHPAPGGSGQFIPAGSPNSSKPYTTKSSPGLQPLPPASPHQATITAIKEYTPDAEYQGMHQRLGCFTCRKAQRQYLGVSAACTYAGPLKIDDNTGKCLTRQEGDPTY